ncbi:MAG TPA: prepilin-type N-terminal cleavage/methylation domain-containing protein [Alphaproteobacteria bacterium]|nr:prepilin-type N-terminal cleavage/methylation domain-containing protein [Alphaproteobacteria bacterium]
MRTKTKRPIGFTLLEMMLSMLILLVVMGAVLSQIANIQMRYHTEENRLNTVEEAREFVDQMVRDVHQSAFPHPRLFAPAVTGTVPYSKSTMAAGLVYASPTKVQFESDLDGTGHVQLVVYQLDHTDLTQCPCILQRGQIIKADGFAPESQPNLPLFTTEVDNVINPVTDPLFRFFDINGNEITGLPMQFDSTKKDGGAIATVYTIKISVTVASKDKDVQSKVRPEVTFTATAEINN